MEATVTSSSSAFISLSSDLSLPSKVLRKSTKSTASVTNRRRINGFNGSLRIKAVINDVSTSADPVEAEVTWQIIVGSIAGLTPFVVAGIEFSKRIAEQRKCEVCKGSGLVLRDKKYYFRCPRCGGFLPWQSWKRFFSG